MRILRASHYSQMSDTPTIAVVRDCDVTDTLDSIRISSRIPPGLTLTDIFEVPDGTEVPEATLLAGERIDRQREHDQAMLFFWTVDRMLPELPAGSSGRYPGPIPLDRDQVVEVMEQVAKHPAYQGNKLGVPTRDGSLVILEGGKVRQ